MRKDIALMLGFLLLPAFLLVHLTGCTYVSMGPGAKRSLAIAQEQCQQGNAAGCETMARITEAYSPSTSITGAEVMRRRFTPQAQDLAWGG
jgi:hypothetical protein